jgi:DNA-binding TFAR19-related protein (PDSD5 family)
MFNSNDLLARIQAGENPDTIADEFAKQLNYAMELDRKQKEAELAAKKEAELQKEADLNRYANDMAEAMLNYIKLANPEVAKLMEEDGGSFNIAEMRNMMDGALKTIILSLKVAAALDPTPISTPDPKAKKTPDDAISQFLKNFGL